MSQIEPRLRVGEIVDEDGQIPLRDRHAATNGKLVGGGIGLKAGIVEGGQGILVRIRRCPFALEFVVSANKRRLFQDGEIVLKAHCRRPRAVLAFEGVTRFFENVAAGVLRGAHELGVGVTDTGVDLEGVAHLP